LKCYVGKLGKAQMLQKEWNQT